MISTKNPPSAKDVGSARANSTAHPRSASLEPREPLPVAAYVLLAALVAVTVFFVVLWTEESGVASEASLIITLVGVVVVVGVLARAVTAHRAYKNRLRWQKERHLARQAAKEHLRLPQSASSATSALRSFERRIARAERSDDSPQMHLDAHKECKNYLQNMEEALRAGNLPVEVRAALRAGQQRIRARQKHHLLSWARSEAWRLTGEAQQQPRAAGKVRLAESALSAVLYALEFEPHEKELQASASAIREFIAYVKIGRRVENAERAAFRGRYERAIDYYYDALFDLSKAEIDEAARDEAGRRIRREIEMLQAFIATAESTRDFGKHAPDG